MLFARYVVPLVLLALSGLLVDSHRRAWRLAQEDHQLKERDRRFARSQYLRRMQGSSIIGFIGIAFACYPLIPHQPLPMAVYLAVLFVACAALMMLALLDVMATRYNAQRIAGEQLASQVKLAIKLKSVAEKTDTKE